VITGGTDCDPVFYNEIKRPGTDEPDTLRDIVDFNLMYWALEDNKPLLAICAGSQRFNVAKNGTLYQDIYDSQEGVQNAHQGHNTKTNRDRPVHHVKVANHPMAQRIFGDRETLQVNSTHKQAIKKVGEGLDVLLQSSSDDIVEGIVLRDHSFAVGLQYHPEAMWQNPGQEMHLGSYKVLVEEAQRFMKK